MPVYQHHFVTDTHKQMVLIKRLQLTANYMISTCEEDYIVLDNRFQFTFTDKKASLLELRVRYRCVCFDVSLHITGQANKMSVLRRR